VRGIGSGPCAALSAARVVQTSRGVCLFVLRCPTGAPPARNDEQRRSRLDTRGGARPAHTAGRSGDRRRYHACLARAEKGARLALPPVPRRAVPPMPIHAAGAPTGAHAPTRAHTQADKETHMRARAHTHRRRHRTCARTAFRMSDFGGSLCEDHFSRRADRSTTSGMRPCHICAGTGAQPCHICSGTGGE
jgi:hypothetical protein